MLTIEETRKLLKDHESPDEKILEIRDNVYQLVELILDQYIKERTEPTK